MKIFDVVNFDLMHLIKLKFAPDLCEYIHKSSSFSSILAISQHNQPIIHLIKSETPEGQVLKTIKDMHFGVISSIKFVGELGVVISTDTKGMVEVWDPETLEIGVGLGYELVSETDFMQLAKNRTYALSCAVSNSGELVAMYCRDRKIRIFNVRTGKLIRMTDDSL